MSWDGRQLFTRSFFTSCSVVSRGSLGFSYFLHGAWGPKRVGGGAYFGAG